MNSVGFDSMGTKRGPRGPQRRTPGPRLKIIRNAALLIGSLTGGTWLVPPGSAVAQTAYYVDGSNSACSNSGSGTQSSPYCTISAALAAHHDPGTTIYVMPGVYHEQVTVPASGISGSPLTLKGLGASGRPVVIDGADDYSNLSLWTQYSGDVWLASSVTWSPVQVFADDARLTPSTAPPGSLPARSFTYVAGSGLYVNAGGGNPATHGTQVGHRLYGFYVSSKSYVSIQSSEERREGGG